MERWTGKTGLKHSTSIIYISFSNFGAGWLKSEIGNRSNGWLWTCNA